MTKICLFEDGRDLNVYYGSLETPDIDLKKYLVVGGPFSDHPEIWADANGIDLENVTA